MALQDRTIFYVRMRSFFKERLAREGVKGSWLVWEKQMHAFPLLWVYGFRESKQAKKWVIDVLKKDA